MILSVSKIDSFNICKQQYYKRYIEKQEARKVPALIVGSFAHDVINELEKYRKPSSKERAPLMKLAYKKLKSSFTGTSQQLVEVKQMLQNFIFMERELGLSVPFKHEWSFKFKLAPDITMCGIVDRIDKKGKSYEIFDYKTSRSSAYLSESLQLPAYKIAVETLLGASVSRCAYLMLRDSSVVDIDVGDTLSIITRIREAQERILSEKEWSPTKNTYLCEFCGFQDSCWKGWDSMSKSIDMEEAVGNK